jgi:hypothetical protein
VNLISIADPRIAAANSSGSVKVRTALEGIAAIVR